MSLPPLPSLISTAPILGFCTGMDFSWVDVYDPAPGTNWKTRRGRMEARNNYLRRGERKGYKRTAHHVSVCEEEWQEEIERKTEEEERKKLDAARR